MKKSISSSLFQEKLGAWYDANHRKLPWRSAKNVYHIWLSEIILQQTRVVQGQGYYQRILEAFPTVQALARAPLEEVLRLWEGLGYYTRARNLHACAKQVVALHGGQFPKTYQALLALPGIGPYTAAAIASIAFEEVVPLVDGNVYRFLARLFGMEEDITQSQGQKKFRALAEKLLPTQNVGRHNQALMEFGALVCKPQAPLCETCPFQKFCQAYATKKQQLLPVKGRKIKIRNRYIHYLVLYNEKGVYMQQRKKKDIWKGLYEFYPIEKEAPCTWQNLTDPLIEEIEKAGIVANQVRWRTTHQLTHQSLHLFFYHVPINEALATILTSKKELRAISWQEGNTIPLPIILRKAYTQFFKANRLL